MGDEQQFADHLTAIAAQDVPDHLDGWTPIQERVAMAQLTLNRRYPLPGMLTLAAALIVVVIGVALVIGGSFNGFDVTYGGGLLQDAATPTPPPLAALPVGSEGAIINGVLGDQILSLEALIDEQVELHLYVHENAEGPLTLELFGQGMVDRREFSLFTFDPKRTPEVTISLTNDYGLLGLRLLEGEGEQVNVSLRLGYPAWRAGLLPQSWPEDVPPMPGRGVMRLALDQVEDRTGGAAMDGDWVRITFPMYYTQSGTIAYNGMDVSALGDDLRTLVSLFDAARSPAVQVADGVWREDFTFLARVSDQPGMGAAPEAYSLLMLPVDYRLLSWALDSGFPVTVSGQYQLADAPAMLADGSLIIPPGSVAVTVDLDTLPGLSQDFQPGQMVDLFGALLNAPLEDGSFQEPVQPDGVVIVPEGIVVQLGSHTEGLTLSITRTVTGAQVVANVDGLMTLAVSPEEATTLAWLIDAGVPLLIVPAA
jgi:hypothetical protein